MALSSIERKELIVAFGHDLSPIADGLYEATTEDLPKTQENAAISAGQRKLREYEDLVGKLQGAHRAEVEKDYGPTVEEIRGFLKTLKER